MRVRRGLLFWGLLLIPLGGIPLLVRAGQLDASRLSEAWRLWPLIVIGAGLLVLANRSPLAIVGILVMALTIGTIGGAALAGGSFWLAGACGFGNDTTTQADRTGDTSPSSVRLDLNCGSIDFATRDATGWTLHSAYRGTEPKVDATADRLVVTSPSGSSQRQDWKIAVQAMALRSLEITANAATSTADLGGAQLDDVHADLNAGDMRLMAGSAGIRNLDVTTNAGRVRLTLGAGDTTGSLSMNAGAIDLCVPPGAALRLEVEDQLTFVTNLSSRNLTRSGNTWTRAGTGGTIDLSIDGNAAAFNLDPNGGC